MKICCISDIHGMYNQVKLPKADVLLLAGDLTNSIWTSNHLEEIVDLTKWLSKIKKKFSKVILIAGNHDICIYKNTNLFTSMLDNDIIYLENSSIDLDGLHVYGSPICPRFYDWAYMADRGPDIARFWAQIPSYTNILLTHTPPQFVLDQINHQGWNLGCHDLADRVKQLSELKLHVFGHIHTGHGVMESPHQELVLNDGEYASKVSTLNVNASLLNEQYDLVYKPITVTL